MGHVIDFQVYKTRRELAAAAHALRVSAGFGTNAEFKACLLRYTQAFTAHQRAKEQSKW